MVEAAGVEPASGNIQHGRLHAYPELWISLLWIRFRQTLHTDSLSVFASPLQAWRGHYPAESTPEQIPQERICRTAAVLSGYSVIIIVCDYV